MGSGYLNYVAFDNFVEILAIYHYARTATRYERENYQEYSQFSTDDKGFLQKSLDLFVYVDFVRQTDNCMMH